MGARSYNPANRKEETDLDLVEDKAVCSSLTTSHSLFLSFTPSLCCSDKHSALKGRRPGSTSWPSHSLDRWLDEFFSPTKPYPVHLQDTRAEASNWSRGAQSYLRDFAIFFLTRPHLLSSNSLPSFQNVIPPDFMWLVPSCHLGLRVVPPQGVPHSPQSLSIHFLFLLSTDP